VSPGGFRPERYRQKFGIRVLIDAPQRIGHPIQPIIVKHDQYTVCRRANVDLGSTFAVFP
jgi:hypothetical protein